ncbi:hypothetical protein YC2023_115105 [Brassica napus]
MRRKMIQWKPSQISFCLLFACLELELRMNYVAANGEVVKAEEIAGAVRSLTDGEDTPGKRMKEMAEAARMARLHGGDVCDRVSDVVLWDYEHELPLLLHVIISPPSAR